MVERRRLELISLYEDLPALEFYYSRFPCSRILYMVLSSHGVFFVLFTRPAPTFQLAFLDSDTDFGKEMDDMLLHFIATQQI